MSSNDTVILSKLEFTKSIGDPKDKHDILFNDATDYGGFPAQFLINGIKRIQFFSDKTKGDCAVIVGITIIYNVDGVDTPVSHGIVAEVDQIGDVSINETELLIGVYGQLKEQGSGESSKRIGSIGFIMLDTGTRTVDKIGPFQGSPKYLADFWATFGQIIAFEGTFTAADGITTLGFVKTTASALSVNKGVEIF